MQKVRAQYWFRVIKYFDLEDLLIEKHPHISGFSRTLICSCLYTLFGAAALLKNLNLCDCQNSQKCVVSCCCNPFAAAIQAHKEAQTHTDLQALKACKEWFDASSHPNQSQVTLCCYRRVSEALIRSAYACQSQCLSAVLHPTHFPWVNFICTTTSKP